MTTLQIESLPKVTNPITELQWACDWWHDQYAEAKRCTVTAWKMYDDAIENGDDLETKRELFNMAETFDAIEREAWHAWDNAKKNYLAVYN